MNVLIVTPYPPVLHVHGGGVRMFHNIRLVARKHSVRVLSFVENDEEMELIKTVEPVCESITAIRRVPDFGAHWFSLAPFMVREFGTPAMHKAVDDAVRANEADVIQCEYLQMAQYKRPGVFSILTVHEAYSANAFNAFQKSSDPVEKLRLFSRWMSMLNYEVSMCNAFDRVITMTEDDRRYLRSYARHSDILAIPIGIDAEYFQPVTVRTPEPVPVVFVGNYRHTPNVEAAEFLLEKVAPHFPETKFIIAGSYLPDGLRKESNVTFPGYIPDTRQLFCSPNTIFAAPLFSGTGQRVKLLEAFAMGVPVITTTLGAAGFPIVNRRQAILADTAVEFRTAIAELLSSFELRLQLGLEGRRMIEEKFNWDRIGEQLLSVLEGGSSVPG